LAIGVTFALYRTLRKNAGGRADITQVVVAARDLPAGVVLTAEDVKLTGWPTGTTLPGSFSKIDDVANHALIYPMGAKEPVLERNLAAQGSGLGLSVKIPTGMRATSVRSNEVVGVAGFLYPGSHVDVLATFALPGSANPVTQTILQDVEVLTAGEQIEPDPQGKPQTVNVVTLLLNGEDSEKLLLASTQGTIQFVLRNSADETKAPVAPTSLNQLVSASPQTAPPAPITAKSSAPKTAASDASGLEIIRGNTRSVEKF
jgi:pilus assembly protein CpaB